MQDTELRDAVNVLNNTPDFEFVDERRREATGLLLDLATQYLAMTKADGVPEEKPSQVMITHTTGENGAIIEHPMADIYAEGWNALRKIMLLLLLKSRKECEELKEKLKEVSK